MSQIIMFQVSINIIAVMANSVFICFVGVVLSTVGMEDYNDISWVANSTAVVSDEGSVLNSSEVYLAVQHGEVKHSGVLEAIEFTVSSKVIQAASVGSVQQQWMMRFQVYRPQCRLPGTVLFSCPDQRGLRSCYPMNKAICPSRNITEPTYRYLSDVPSYVLVGEAVVNLMSLGNTSHNMLILNNSEAILVEPGDVLGYQVDMIPGSFVDMLKSNHKRNVTMVRVLLASEGLVRYPNVGDEITLTEFEYELKHLVYVRVFVTSSVPLRLPDEVQDLLATRHGVQRVISITASNRLGIAQATSVVAVYDPIQNLSYVCPFQLLNGLVALPTISKAVTVVFRLDAGTTTTLHYSSQNVSGSASFVDGVSTNLCSGLVYREFGLFAFITFNASEARTINMTVYATNLLGSSTPLGVIIVMQDAVSSVSLLVDDMLVTSGLVTTVSTAQNVTLSAATEGGTAVEYCWRIIGNSTVVERNGIVFIHSFEEPGDYQVELVVKNFVSSVLTTGSIQAQNEIRGLRILPIRLYVSVNETVVFERYVTSGSHLRFNWSFTHELTGHKDSYFHIHKGSQHYRFVKEGLYHIQLITNNDISGPAISFRSVVVIPKIEHLEVKALSSATVNTGVQVNVSFTGAMVNVTVMAGNETRFFSNLNSRKIQALFTFVEIGVYVVNVTALNPVTSPQTTFQVIVVDRKPDVALIVPERVLSATGKQVVVTASVSADVFATFEWLVFTESYPNGTSVFTVGATIQSNNSHSFLLLESERPVKMEFSVCSIVKDFKRCTGVAVIFENPVMQQNVSLQLVPVNNSLFVKRGSVLFMAVNLLYGVVVDVGQGCPACIALKWDHPESVISFQFPVCRLHNRSGMCTGNTVTSDSFRLTESGRFMLNVTVHNEISSVPIQAILQAERVVKTLLLRRYPDRLAYEVNDNIDVTGDFGFASDVTFQWSVSDADALQLISQVLENTTSHAKYRISREGRYTVQGIASNTISRQTAKITLLVQTVLSRLEIVTDGNVVNDRELVVTTEKFYKFEAVAYGSANQYFWTVQDAQSFLKEPSLCLGLNQSSALAVGRQWLVTFPSPGLYVVFVCATNFLMKHPISANVTMNVLAPIKEAKMIVFPSSTILQNTTAMFVIQLARGTLVTYKWTVNDPLGFIVTSMESTSPSFNFHFRIVGDYTVTSKASNDVSSGDLLQTVVHVQPLLCLPPLLTPVTLPLVQEHLRSRSFQLEVSATPNCTLYRIRYKWTVYPKTVGADCSVKAFAEMSLRGIATVNPIIAVPARYFQLGTYCFRFEASLGTSSSTETFVVLIKESPLVATIIGGDTRLIGALQGMRLDGTGSYDPDDILATHGTLSYFWFCWSTVSLGGIEACEAIDDLAAFEIDSNCSVGGDESMPSVGLSANTLQAGRTYLFELQVLKGTRNSSAQQQVVKTHNQV